jgi:hypothetical protein
MKEETLRRPFVAASRREERKMRCSTRKPIFAQLSSRNLQDGGARTVLLSLSHIFYWANCVTRTKIQMKCIENLFA